MRLTRFHRLAAHLAFVLFLTSTTLLHAQEGKVPREAPAKSIEALENTLPALKQEERNLEELREELKSAASDSTKEKLEAQISATQERISELQANFRTIASGVDEESYFSEGYGTITLNEQVEEILRPFFTELREATATPREMEEMRKNLQNAEERRRLAQSALARLDALIESDLIDDEMRSETTEVRDLWKERLTIVDTYISVLSAKIEERERNSPGTFEVISEGISSFWRSKGKHLLYGLASFIITFFIFNRLYRLFKRVSPFHKKGKHRFTTRLVDLVAGALTILIALTSVLIIWYVQGDWLLLTIAVIIAVGLVFASRNSLPPHIEQIRTMLNLGPVREGERMLYDGIPWRVDHLGFYCHFSNPLLDGGHLRLPIRELTDLHSRPVATKEPWFPTKETEWVKLGNDTYGKVVQQTPERVTVLHLGGSRKIYPTSDFLALAPENLSHGFRVQSVFGIDYGHQAICTEQVPAIFQERLEKELIEKFGAENVRSVKVEFSSAGSSSLDYTILADFDGEVASRYNVISRMLQKVCTDVCNEQEWVIPFTQLTIHQA